MGFRKQKPQIEKLRQWREFLVKHAALIHDLGLPAVIMESEDHWRNFIHNGKLEMADDLTHYSLPSHDDRGYKSLLQLIDFYFTLRGPCISLWPKLLSREEDQSLEVILGEKC